MASGVKSTGRPLEAKEVPTTTPSQLLASMVRSLQRTVLPLAILCVLPTLAVRPLLAQTFSVIHYFTGNGDGDWPYGGITLDGGGNLYGTTLDAAPGAVFEMKKRDGSWVLYKLVSLNPNVGAFPGTGVVFGPDGALYGTTLGGGSGTRCQGGCGAVYRVTPPLAPCRSVMCNWTATNLYSFSGGQDGSSPGYRNVAFDRAGNLYGTTTAGGDHGMGVIFELTRSGNTWTETVLHSFTGVDGATPETGVILDADGNLYGTTAFGGAFNQGSVYQLAHSGSGWVLNTLYSFQAADDGYNPIGGLIFDGVGNLYGSAVFGGSGGGGTIFELSPSGGAWQFTLLAAIPPGGYIPGGPTGSLAFGAGGNLYGTTNSNGVYGLGSVFKLHYNGSGWTYTTLHDFSNSQNDGEFPVPGPTIGPLNTLYGTASNGGLQGMNCIFEAGCGIVWEITP